MATRSSIGEHLILITTHAPEQALADYRRRWEMECLFAAMKRRGFNLEDTHLVEAERISRLMAVLTLTMCWCYKIGVWVEQQQSPKANRKSHQRRANSIIRLGYDRLRRALLNAAAKPAQVVDLIRLLFRPLPLDSLAPS